VEPPVGRDHIRAVADGRRQLVQFGQLLRGDPGSGPFGRLAGERRQDGEVVDGVLGGEPGDGDPAPGRDRDQALVGELEQGLPNGGPADAELGGELVEVEPVPRLQSAREDAVAQLVGRLGPDGGADQFDI